MPWRDFANADCRDAAVSVSHFEGPLAFIAERWPYLPPHLREAVLALVCCTCCGDAGEGGQQSAPPGSLRPLQLWLPYCWRLHRDAEQRSFKQSFLSGGARSWRAVLPSALFGPFMPRVGKCTQRDLFPLRYLMLQLQPPVPIGLVIQFNKLAFARDVAKLPQS